MGTTFLAPSGGKADLPLPGVTQGLALWARIFTILYIHNIKFDENGSTLEDDVTPIQSN